MKRLRRLPAVIMFCMFPVVTVAQYYERAEYESFQLRYVGAGVMWNDFAGRSTNTAEDSLAIKFNRVVPVLSLRQGLFELQAGYGRYSLHGRTRSTVFLNANISTEVVISGSRPGVLLLPISLATDYRKAEGPGADRDDFNLASIGLGAGLAYRYFTHSVEFSMSVREILHYSFSGFSTNNGFSAATLGEAVVVLPGLLVADGIVVGYRFRLQTWSMNDTRFNYRLLAHGPFFGVMF
jgi:hypothetical protein